MKKTIKLPLLALFVTLISCSAPQYRDFSGMVWNTTFSVTYCSDKVLEDSVRAVFRSVELSVSPFNDKSIVSAVNRGENPALDSIFSDVFAVSQTVCSMSGGLFDPTIAPIVNIWGFGYEKGVEPTDSAISEVLKTVGILDCKIVNGHVQKKSPYTKFDFSAVAKGYGCDAVARMLERNGCTDYLVEIGGEIAVKGHNSKGNKWKVMIDAPVESNEEVRHERLAVIEVTDCGVATSGNYRNYYTDENGNKISHTLSPLTGRPAVSDLLSVTVIAPDCATADALATACMALGLEKAKEMIENAPGVSALFVTSGSESEWKTVSTKGFPEILR